MSVLLRLCLCIGVGTRGAPGAHPPQVFSLFHICSVLQSNLLHTVPPQSKSLSTPLLCNVTHPYSNCVPMQAVTSCSHPLNYQPKTAGNFNALHLGVVKVLQNPVATIETLLGLLAKNYIRYDQKWLQNPEKYFWEACPKFT